MKILRVFVGTTSVLFSFILCLYVLFKPEEYKTDSGTCPIIERCGDLVYIDCGQIIDGPTYYVNTVTKKIVGGGGGFCMRQICKTPKEWTCEPKNSSAKVVSLFGMAICIFIVLLNFLLIKFLFRKRAVNE